MGFEPLQLLKLHALEGGIQVEYVKPMEKKHAAKVSPGNTW